MDGRGILVRCPAESKDLLVSKLSRSTLKLTQTSIQWESGTYLGGKAFNWTLGGYESLELYLYSTTYLRGVYKENPTLYVTYWAASLMQAINWHQLSIILRIVAMLASWEIPSIINGYDVVSESFHPRFTLSTASGIDLLHFDPSSSTTVVYLTTLSVSQAVWRRIVDGGKWIAKALLKYKWRGLLQGPACSVSPSHVRLNFRITCEISGRMFAFGLASWM
jgi:hypothetical protein